MIYFGIKDFCESTRWNQQFALIRHEETFDVTVPKANRYKIHLKINIFYLPEQ